MRFYINETLADFYQEDDLAPRFYYKTIDIESIDLAGGNYALNLKLPKTFNNNEIFQFINRVEQEENFWYNVQYTARIELDGNDIFIGTLTIDKVTYNDYECSLIGENIDWSSNLEKSLREIESFNRPNWSGVRSTLYNPFPQQYIDSIGYRDIWLDASGVNSLKEDNSDLEFCCPLISYGNFPAPRTFDDRNITGAPIDYVPVPINASDAGGDNRWCLYNTEEDPLNWGSIFPCAYLRSTVINIFKDNNINVSGDFIIKDKYKNIFLPFTSADRPNWNWGLMHRVNIDWKQLDGSPGVAPYNRYSFLSGQTNSQVRTTPSTTFNNIYIKLFANNIGTADAQLPTDITINERYIYQDSFRLSTDLIYDNNINCFVSQIKSQFHIRWEIKGFGGLFAPSQWFKSTSTTPGFYFILVNRGKVFESNQSVLGNSGNGLIDITNHLILDSQVLHSQFYDTTTGAYDSLEFTSQDFIIDAIVDLDEFDTLELMFVSIDENPLPGGLPQYITMDQFITSNLTIEALNQDIGLNPAKFLPDISQKDFLRSVLNMYNLFLYYDNNSRTVYINEYENYFLPASASIDWSNKCSLDDTSLQIESGFTFKNVNLKLTADDNDVYERIDNIETDYTITNNFNYWNETKDIELVHAFTSTRNYYVTSELIGNNNVLPDDDKGLLPGDSPIILFSIDIPTMSTEDVYEAQFFELYEGSVTRSYDFIPRLLKYIGIKPISITKSFWIEDIAFNMISGDFYYPYSVQEDLVSEFNPRFIGTNSLLPDWIRWINLVNKKTNISLDAYLTSGDIARLDIRRPVKIGKELFIISSIEEFNPVTPDVCKIKLYKK
jgi:hypothetical protein